MGRWPAGGDLSRVTELESCRSYERSRRMITNLRKRETMLSRIRTVLQKTIVLKDENEDTTPGVFMGVRQICSGDQLAARDSQNSSQRPLSWQHLGAMMAFAPRTVQCIPDNFRRCPKTTLQPASTRQGPRRKEDYDIVRQLVRETKELIMNHYPRFN